MTIFEEILREAIEDMIVGKLEYTTEVPITISKIPHSDERIGQRNIDEKQITKSVKLALPKIFADYKLGKLQAGDECRFVIVNKTNCVICVCSLYPSENIFGVEVRVITTFLHDGKINAEWIQSGTIVYYVGKAGKLWYEAQETLERYGKSTGKGYHKYLTYMDQYGERLKNAKESGKEIYPNKKAEIMKHRYAELYPKVDDVQKKREMAQGFNWIKQKAQNKAKEKEKLKLFNQMADNDLYNTNKDADARILTPRGPNGTLRSIDKQRAKATKNQRQLKENIYDEGGLGGHMAHPYEYSDLTFIDLQELIHDLFNARVEHVTEKLDGQNIFVTLDDNKEVRFGRNGSDCINGGMNGSEIIEKWKGNPEVQKLYETAYNIFTDGLKNVPADFFRMDNAQIWMNCEVINPDHPNVIPYPQSEVSVHMLKAFIDGTKEETEIPPQIEQEKLNYLKQLFATTKSEHGHIQMTPEIVLNVVKASDEQEKEFLSMLNKVVVSAENGNPSMTIDQWKRARFIEYCRKYNCTDVFQLDNITDLLFGRWLDGRTDNEYKKIPILKQIKATYPEKYEKIVKEVEFIEKGEGKGLLKQIMIPLENFFIALGNVVLQNVSGYENSERSQEIIGRIQSILTHKISEIESYGTDSAEYMKFATILQKIPNIGEKINALEGIVFNWRGKTMKLTGSFAPLNQIMGIGKFGR